MNALVALLLVPAAVLAQPPAEPTLHAAWLRETFYLDVAGAAQDYARLAADVKAPSFERALAAARLTELQRLGGAAGTAPAPATDLPPQLRERLRQLQQNRPNTDELLAHVQEGPEPLLAFWQQKTLSERPNPADRSNRAGRDPAALTASTRPLVGDVQRWVLEQSGPGVNERRRQLLAQLQGAQRSGDQELVSETRRQLQQLGGGRSVFAELRGRALQVLLRELDGQIADAEQRRDLYFPSWRAPAPPKDPAAALADARRRLDELRYGGNLLPTERDTLARLAERLGHLDSDPAAAMQLLERLPYYCERLRGLPSSR